MNLPGVFIAKKKDADKIKVGDTTGWVKSDYITQN